MPKTELLAPSPGFECRATPAFEANSYLIDVRVSVDLRPLIVNPPRRSYRPKNELAIMPGGFHAGVPKTHGASLETCGGASIGSQRSCTSRRYDFPRAPRSRTLRTPTPPRCRPTVFCAASPKGYTNLATTVNLAVHYERGTHGTGYKIRWQMPGERRGLSSKSLP
jgi:hypothetical protein